MGKVGDALFGKKPKPESSESGNKAYDYLKGQFGSTAGYTGDVSSGLAGLLGLNGAAAQTEGLDNWANSGGMDFLMKNMQKGVTSSKAAQGLLQSGSYGTALQDRAYGLSSTYLNQYMDQMLGLGKLGLGAGGILGSAGQYSKGTGAQQGKAGILPMAIAAFA
jgi:hypothetical protein